MMRNCAKCSNNNWKFKKIENWIQAICKICDYEVMFQARAKSTKFIKPSFK